jgi:hypothetical protein
MQIFYRAENCIKNGLSYMYALPQERGIYSKHLFLGVRHQEPAQVLGVEFNCFARSTEPIKTGDLLGFGIVLMSGGTNLALSFVVLEITEPMKLPVPEPEGSVFARVQVEYVNQSIPHDIKTAITLVSGKVLIAVIAPDRSACYLFER